MAYIVGFLFSYNQVMEGAASFLQTHGWAAALGGGILMLLVVLLIAWDDASRKDHQPDLWFEGYRTDTSSFKEVFVYRIAAYLWRKIRHKED